MAGKNAEPRTDPPPPGGTYYTKNCGTGPTALGEVSRNPKNLKSPKKIPTDRKPYRPETKQMRVKLLQSNDKTWMASLRWGKFSRIVGKQGESGKPAKRIKTTACAITSDNDTIR